MSDLLSLNKNLFHKFEKRIKELVKPIKQKIIRKLKDSKIIPKDKWERQ